MKPIRDSQNQPRVGSRGRLSSVGQSPNCRGLVEWSVLGAASQLGMGAGQRERVYRGLSYGVNH